LIHRRPPKPRHPTPARRHRPSHAQARFLSARSRYKPESQYLILGVPLVRGRLQVVMQRDADGLEGRCSSYCNYWTLTGPVLLKNYRGQPRNHPVGASASHIVICQSAVLPCYTPQHAGRFYAADAATTPSPLQGLCSATGLRCGISTGVSPCSPGPTFAMVLRRGHRRFLRRDLPSDVGRCLVCDALGDGRRKHGPGTKWSDRGDGHRWRHSFAGCRELAAPEVRR